MAVSLAQAAANLSVGLLLGAAIGLERQWRQRLAGLRTNALVALGAAIFILYGRIVSDDAAARMAPQVVSGIGFLGAGVIFKEGLNVRGLNTAATLWCSAAVGLLAGEGYAVYAGVAAALVLGANLALRPLVQAINRQPVELDGRRDPLSRRHRMSRQRRRRGPRRVGGGLRQGPRRSAPRGKRDLQSGCGPRRDHGDPRLAQTARNRDGIDRGQARQNAGRDARRLARQRAGDVRVATGRHCRRGRLPRCSLLDEACGTRRVRADRGQRPIGARLGRLSFPRTRESSAVARCPSGKCSPFRLAAHRTLGPRFRAWALK